MLDHLKDTGKSQIAFEELARIMSNMNMGQFSYESFKKAYDSDPKLQELITDFNQDGITLKTSEVDDLPEPRKGSQSSVSSMAKRATKL